MWDSTGWGAGGTTAELSEFVPTIILLRVADRYRQPWDQDQTALV